MNRIANRQVICEVLLERAAVDPELVVLCTDSRGSASLAPFAERYPARFIELGIAEQNIVSVAAGLARAGKRPVAASPACFLSTRAMEQVKVDVAYSQTNVKLIGISGGISYGALGMTHHSAQDIATMGSIPGLGVYLPSDRHQTRWLLEALLDSDAPAYLRVGRNPVPDVYAGDGAGFAYNSITQLRSGADLALIACGELVRPALDAAIRLAADGIDASVLDVHALKPLDRDGILNAVRTLPYVLVVEEHGPHGGLGSLVCQLLSERDPKPVRCLGLPDAPVVAGPSPAVFQHYGLDAAGIAASARAWVQA